jgi:hypothetical protein
MTSREPWRHFTSVVFPSSKLYNETSRKSKELSTETKELVIKLYRKKERKSYISDLLDIPWSTIGSVVKKYRSTGRVENQPRKGRRKLFTARVLWFFVSFTIFFSDNTRVRIFVFVAQSGKFFSRIQH